MRHALVKAAGNGEGISWRLHLWKYGTRKKTNGMATRAYGDRTSSQSCMMREEDEEKCNEFHKERLLQ